MLEVEVNPPGAGEEYLRHINDCFGGWGTPAKFDWCFARQAGGPPADLIVMRLQGRMIAGSAVTYRRVLLADGTPLLAGVLTGSWTLPEARGQGCFSRAIDETLALTAAHGGGLVLGCGTETNASARRIAAAGSALFPTVYASSGPGTPLPPAGPAPAPPADPERALAEMRDALERAQAGHVRIHYTPDEWRAQFLERPNPVEFLALGDDGWCVVEPVGEFDRVQALVPRASDRLGACLGAVLRRAMERGRRTFVFSASPEWARQFEILGLERTPGYLYTLVADPGRLRDALRVDAPWPADYAAPLVDPRHPWYLGPWSVQTGDRM